MSYFGSIFAREKKRVWLPMRSGLGSRFQRGFTLIELSVAMAIAGVLAIMGARLLVEQALEKQAEGTGAYFNTVRGALDKYLAANWLALSRGDPVTGYANPLAPTLAELKTGLHLPGAFPDVTPFDSRVAIQIVRTGCPGLSCRMDALAYQLQPLRDSSGEPRYGIATTFRSATTGGLASDPFSPARLRGPTGEYVNPLGTVGAAIGVTTQMDTALYAQFIRRNDDRPTQLNEALTVNAGPLATGGVALQANGNAAVTGALAVGGATTLSGPFSTTGGMTVRNAAGVDCVTMTPAGVVTISCAGQLNARNGTFTDSSGNSVSIAPTGIAATGRVAAAGGVSTATASLYDSAAPDRIVVSGTQTFIFGASGRLVSFDAGDVVAEGNVSGRRLAMREAATAGGVCSTTSGPLGTGAEFAATATGGMAVCAGGRWVPLQEVATQGAVCPTDAAGAVDGTTSAALVCRGGRWTNTMSLLSAFVLIKTEEVTDNVLIAQPNCVANGGAYAGIPLLLLQAKNEGSSDATFNRVASVEGSNWRVHLTDSVGPLAGALAIAMSYCLYTP